MRKFCIVGDRLKPYAKKPGFSETAKNPVSRSPKRKPCIVCIPLSASRRPFQFLRDRGFLTSGIRSKTAL